MGKLHKLIKKARQSQANIPLEDACYMAERVGFIEDGGKGAHRYFKHGTHKGRILNFQSNRGKAWPYQVKQLLSFLDDHPEMIPNDEQ